MSKGSAFSRALNYFRTADFAEAQACLSSCEEIMRSREGVKSTTRRTRKSTKPAQTTNTMAAAAGATE